LGRSAQLRLCFEPMIQVATLGPATLDENLVRAGSNLFMSWGACVCHMSGHNWISVKIVIVYTVFPLSGALLKTSSRCKSS
jgi:hypothetical protein